jgi:hypothetical protein
MQISSEYVKHFMWVDIVILCCVVVCGALAHLFSISPWFFVVIWMTATCPIPIILAARWYVATTRRSLSIDFFKSQAFVQSIIGSLCAFCVVVAATYLGVWVVA